jgi:uncharacterized membrane protein YhaH (DUF805 family)
MNAGMRAVGWLFDPRGRVDARAYLRTGVLLVALKYAVDAALVALVVHRLWRPSGYLGPLLGVRAAALAGAPAWLLWVMALWAVPFLFIGVSLSVRRLADAGRSPWWALLFVAPWANYLLMATLSLLPTRPGTGRFVVRPPVEDPSARDALVALGASIAITIPTVALNALVLRTYSAGLFLGTPFSLGVVAAYFYNWKRLHALRATLLVVTMGILCAALALMAVALEGVVCIAMATPLALGVALLGAVIGREMAIRGTEDVIRVGAVIALAPLVPGAAAPVPPALHEVRSAIVVEAPPEAVWRRVVSFGEIPEPPAGLFRLGVAYPVRAVIAGEGVGAIRRCVFSTGTFVEPITAWDEPRRLAFDVSAEPRPMREWSPYATVHAPHLDGYLRSRRGEFRLVPLPGGRTRLEGSTWYTLAMEPAAYWRPFADGIIHRIHLRVLRHVARLASGDAGRAP